MNKLFWGIFSGILSILIAIKPSVSIESAKSALSLCANILAPSLFPFFVCASLLTSSGVAEKAGRRLGGFMKTFFSVSGAGALPFVLGLVSGYPMGALITCKLYDSKNITKSDAIKLLSFTNNSGPLFIMGAVGIGIYGSTKIGYILFISHAAAAIMTGFVFRFFKDSQKKHNFTPQKPFHDSNILGTAVSDSIKSLLNLSGFVVFFAVILAMLENIGFIGFLSSSLIKFGVDEKTSILLSKGFFELTTGISTAKSGSIPAVSSILAWGGISVLFQTLSIVKKSGLPIKSYIAGKLLCGGFAALISRIILNFYPVEIKVSITNSNLPLKIKMYLYYLVGSAAIAITIFTIFCFLSTIFSKKYHD